MALTTKKFLDFEGLSTYNDYIQEQIPTPDGSTITVDENGHWQAHSANNIEYDTNNERLSIYNLATVPAVMGETLTI